MSVDFNKLSPEELEGIAKTAFSNDIGLQLGPLLLGCIFDFMLCGVVIQQFQSWWSYCKPTERKPIVYLTSYALVHAIAWSGMVVGYALHNFVYNFGVFRVFLEMPYFTAFPVVGMASSTLIQGFYIERSYRLNNRNRFLLSFLIICVLGEWTAAIILLVKVTSVASLLQATEGVPHTRAWQCMTLGTDLVITASIGWGLWCAKTGWSHTDALVKKLILVTLETQLGPTLLMAAFTIELSIKPDSTIGVFFDILIPKAYTVGYLAILNTRVHLKRRDQTTSASKDAPQLLGSGRLQQATVHVETDTYVETYQVKEPAQGLNRLDEHPYAESIENLDYTSNLSKQNLNKPTQAF
uniref:DUF6534 domain-containing protein n=1 Tax=Kwoniella bestiolae CBS 10118 TaxID=1296100 RepID=A0A1B9G0E0_9TREE|nr:hypothetical protein I302_05945 [Kwoniella bestiolae CBS 10118]OCF24485.1 hypothetical protein I302_05945 [Kwoniella bestiolae CBS 10118]